MPVQMIPLCSHDTLKLVYLVCTILRDFSNGFLSSLHATKETSEFSALRS
jgi:hypothetical protein